MIYRIHTAIIALFMVLAVFGVADAAEVSCRSELGGYCADDFAATALAQSTPGLEFLGPASTNIGELLVRIYVFALGLVVLAAFVGLVFAGGAYLLARDSEKWVGVARTWAGNAIFGLVLALLSYLILYTINPKLIEGLNLNPREITNVKPGGVGPGGVPPGGAPPPGPGPVSCEAMAGRECDESPNCTWDGTTCRPKAGQGPGPSCAPTGPFTLRCTPSCPPSPPAGFTGCGLALPGVCICKR